MTDLLNIALKVILLKGNYSKYLIISTLYNTALIFFTGSVIQGFMLECGISEENVSFFVSAMQMVQAVIMLLMSGYIENTKRIIKIYAASVILQLILPTVLVIFALKSDIGVNPIFYTLLGIGGITSIMQGVYSILSYKVPYHVIDMNNYGKIIGIAGILNCILSAVASLLLSVSIAGRDYFKSVSWFFAASSIAIAIAGIVAFTYKEKIPEREKSEKKKINLLLYRPFSLLIVPNVLRGLSAGIFGVAAVIGVSFKIIDGTMSGTLTFLAQLGMLVGNFLYLRLNKKISDEKTILLTSIIYAIFLPMLILRKATNVFFVVYLILNIALIPINIGVPVAVTKIVSYNCIGQYSAWRMLIHTAGVSLGGFLSVYMIKWMGGFYTLLIAGLCQLISGIGYYIIMKKLPRV